MLVVHDGLNRNVGTDTGVEDLVVYSDGRLHTDARTWAVAEGPATQTVFTLPPGRWRDEITGREHEGTVFLPELWSALPVALLTRAAP